MKHWVMDYETLSDCFVAVFEHYKTNETKTFVVHDLQNDFNKFIDFLKENIEKGKSSADDLLEKYHGSWNRDLTKIFEEYSY